MKTTIIGMLLLITIMLSCSPTYLDYQYIKSKNWTHDSGFKVGKGDMVSFEKNQTLFQLKSDTIFYDGAARAIIKLLDKKYFNLTISSLDGKDIGLYVNVEGQQLK